MLPRPDDGAFDSNVILQIKNGPMDFQVREPPSPLLAGGMPKSNVMMEVQAAQEKIEGALQIKIVDKLREASALGAKHVEAKGAHSEAKLQLVQIRNARDKHEVALQKAEAELTKTSNATITTASNIKAAKTKVAERRAALDSAATKFRFAAPAAAHDQSAER